VEREIKLDGGEISILKAIGISGGGLHGKILLDRIGEVEAVEFLDTLKGLIDLGYVVATKVNVMTMEDVERSGFRVNPSYARDLKDSLRPGGRRREETRERRRSRV
jgi:hypothetical protein